MRAVTETEKMRGSPWASGMGCSVCSIATDPRFAHGLIFGVLCLFIVTLLVLALLARFFIQFWQRAKKENPE